MHFEHHRIHRLSWLRAAVLGANDGILSVASIVLGVAAARADTASILLAGIAGLVAGAASMAAGEFVSVASQRDMEQADLAREAEELRAHPTAERHELIDIYVQRGLDRNLATAVADQLMERDALGAHARDELGLSDTHSAQPLLAAVSSALAFASGGALPLLVLVAAPMAQRSAWVFASALVALAGLGAASARAGGARIHIAAARIAFWGIVAMGCTTAVGRVFGVAV